MKQQDLIALALDFTSLLFTKLDPSNVRRIVLFGSVARGEFDRKSDIDIFIDTQKQVGPEVKECEKSFESVRERRWDLKGITLPLKVICADLDKPAWHGIRDEIEDHGITLYGPTGQTKEKDHYLITFTSTHLPSPERTRLQRRLFGYTIRKEGKSYPQAGRIAEEMGTKICNHTAIIPTSSKRAIETILKEAGAKFQTRKIHY